MPKLTDEEDAAPKQGISEKTGQVSKEVRELVFNFEEPLRYLQRASEVETCDWRLDLPAGPELTLPHLQKAMELRSIALLRARIHFENDDSHGALADTLAPLKLARDCGASPLIISYIIGMTIDKSATEVLLDNWGELDADQRSGLRAAITELLEENSFDAAIGGEGKSFCAWLLKELWTSPTLIPAAPRDSPKRTLALSKFKKTDFIKSRDQLDRDYQTVAGIAGLPREEQTKRLADFEAKLQSARKLEKPEDATRYFSTQYMPNIGPPTYVESCNPSSEG